MWGLSLALLGGGLVLTWLKPLHAQLRHRDPVRCPVLASVGYSTVGALIVARRPDNAIGWIFRVMAVGFAGTMFSQGYAVRAIAIAPHSLPAVGWIGYQAGWLLLLGSAPIILVFAIRAAATAASTSSSVASRTSAWICAVAGLRSSRTGPCGGTDCPSMQSPRTIELPCRSARKRWQLRLSELKVDHFLPDASALFESTSDGGSEMDPPIEPRKCGLFCRLEERVEGAGGQAAIIVGVIRERQRPEQIGEDLRRGSRLNGVPGGVLRERRGH